MMMSWNYRIFTDGKLWFIAETFYENETIIGWSSGDGLLTDWDSEKYLRDTYHQIGEAFTRPVIEVRGEEVIGDYGDPEQPLGEIPFLPPYDN